MSLLRQQRRIFCFFGRTVPDNRRACSALTGIGEHLPNKQDVIFSKMTLLANMILYGIYVSVKEKFALHPSVFQCKCKRKIYAIFENRVKNGEEIASYNGGESCHAAK